MSLIFSRRMTRATSGRNSSRRAQRMLALYLRARFFHGASSVHGAPALQTCKRKYGHMRGRAGPALAFKVNANGSNNFRSLTLLLNGIKDNFSKSIIPFG